MTTVRLIGYWRSEEHPEYPDPTQLVDAEWDDDERRTVSMYLASGTISRTFMGYSPCRFCGQNNGDLEFTDGVYAWPSGLGHYVDQHGVRLPQNLIDHAAARFDEIESSDLNLDWWLSAARS